VDGAVAADRNNDREIFRRASSDLDGCAGGLGEDMTERDCERF
jgi:hypothetical protein